MFKCECVYRKFKNPKYVWRTLYISKEYKRLIKQVQKALKENKQVEFEHTIVWPKHYDWYDKVTVTICN